ncbi:MAG: hypothetical protein ACJAU1_001342, partial [Psychromonas sp.]
LTRVFMGHIRCEGAKAMILFQLQDQLLVIFNHPSQIVVWPVLKFI